MAPNLKHKIIGVRPGEKIHEIMCPKDTAHATLAFKDHYVIKPEIIFFERKTKFEINNLQEKGKLVDKDFEYNSGSNENFLKLQEIKNYLPK